MIRTIINGDDFGISENVNEAVRECFEKRLITNTTLMVNMPCTDEAVRLAEENGFREAVGLHLNLTSGFPLTERIKRERRFCRKDGSFNAFFAQHTMSRLMISKSESAAVREEIEAQIRKYFAYGLPERHLDSHHHVHTNSSVMDPLLPLLTKYGFRSVRLSRNLFVRMNPVKKIYKGLFNAKLKRNGFITADYFGSYKDLSAMNGKIRDGALVEIMVHPMYNEEGELCDTRIPMKRVSELLDSLNAERQPYFPV